MSNLVVSALGAIAILALGCSESTGPKPAAEPAAIVRIDTTRCFPGEVATVNLRLEPTDTGRAIADSLSAFDFLICYDLEKLDFIDPPVRGPNISEWKSFSYRTESVLPCGGCKLGIIRLTAARSPDNPSQPSPPQLSLAGIIASLQFQFTHGNSDGDSLAIGFGLMNWSDNSITKVGSEHILLIPDTALGGISYVAGYDTSQCPRLYKLRPVLQLQSGWIRVKQPVEDPKGDVDLNGIRYQVNDAVVFSNYFTKGYAAFDPQRAASQIAETDCDGDGEPLTRANLAEMLRVITGQVPVGDTFAIPYKDTLKISPGWDGSKFIISCQSTVQIDELWLSILGPAPVGTFQYLGDPPSIISTAMANGHLLTACGTVAGKHIFGPELGDRFAILGYNGHWLAIKAQASRYPGVAMVVNMGPFADTLPSPYVDGP